MSATIVTLYNCPFPPNTVEEDDCLAHLLIGHGTNDTFLTKNYLFDKCSAYSLFKSSGNFQRPQNDSVSKQRKERMMFWFYYEKIIRNADKNII